MEDIFVVKRCNKIIIHGRRAGEFAHHHLMPLSGTASSIPVPTASSVTATILKRTRGMFADS
jgi:hypothetical protein